MWVVMVGLDRQEAARQAREALEIIRLGVYVAPDGSKVSIAAPLKRSIRNTRSFFPDDGSIPTSKTSDVRTRIEVTTESTFAAANRLVREGHLPAALNFASAKKPGGGFINGAKAQEEALARSSGLYECIRDDPMYAYHAENRDPLYASYAIYSPGVPVFRGDDATLLNEPFLTAVITAPAPNAGEVLKSDPTRGEEVRRAMQERIMQVLGIAAMFDHDAVVLGAWGCGVFRNDTDEVAQFFYEALTGPFRGAFERVVFAILDSSEERVFVGPFERRFNPDAQ